MNRLWTPQSATITDPPMPQLATLWPSKSPHSVLRQWLTIFSSEYYQILIATHLPTPEGWKAELAWASWVWITCSRLLLESSPGGTCTRNLWVTSLRPYHHATESLRGTWQRPAALLLFSNQTALLITLLVGGHVSSCNSVSAARMSGLILGSG